MNFGYRFVGRNTFRVCVVTRGVQAATDVTGAFCLYDRDLDVGRAGRRRLRKEDRRLPHISSEMEMTEY